MGFGADASDVLISNRVLPVVVIDDVRQAKHVGRALHAGGLTIAEVTFRTPAAESALEEMAAVPGLTVGAGTIISAEQADRAAAAGADFIVSPGLSTEVIQLCQARALAVFPGVATATEVIKALTLSVTKLKFFPAELLGGLAAISALASAFPQVQFLPTGGINAQNVDSYLRHPAVIAVGGSWMVARELIREENWMEITRRSAAVVTAVSQSAKPT